MQTMALATTSEDIAYVRAGYVTLDELARGLGEHAWKGRHLPRATYRLGDGSEWYPHDWWGLFDGAGDTAGVAPLFERRLRAEAEALGHPCDVREEWEAYLAGLYGACLREVTPEGIVRKERLVTRLDRAVEDPRPDDARWLAALHEDIDALDSLTRPFAACDRIRFGRPTSRDRLIDAARRAFPFPGGER